MIKNFRGWLRKHATFLYAMSLAASWAWGTSLVVGMNIVQNRGVVPFLIWGVANSLALPLFGYLAFRIPYFDDIMKSKPVVLFQSVVQVFALWIQMNAIYEITESMIGATAATILALAIAVLFLFLMYTNGIWRGVVLDQPIWTLCYGAMIVIAISGFVLGGDTREIVMLNSMSDVSWALYTCLVLFCGPLMNLPFWQVARKIRDEGKMQAFNISGVLFAVYLVLVYILAAFEFVPFMNLLLTITVCCVSISTIDNAIVGLQEFAGRKVGFVTAAASIIAWPIVIPMGVMNLWLTMGTARIWVTAACFVWCAWKCLYRKERENG